MKLVRKGAVEWPRPVHRYHVVCPECGHLSGWWASRPQMWPEGLGLSTSKRPCPCAAHGLISSKPWRPEEKLLSRSILCKLCLEAKNGLMRWPLRASVSLFPETSEILQAEGWLKQCGAVVTDESVDRLEKNREFLVCQAARRVLPEPFGNWV